MKTLIYSLPAINQKTIKLIRILVLFLLFTSVCYSQVSERWVQRNNGPGNSEDEVNACTVDNMGNVYVTGRYTVSGAYDYGTIKYDAAGNQLWIKTYNGPGNSTDYSKSIAVDNLGNVYVTGFSVGNGTGNDFATIKYDAAGNELWVKRYNGGNSERSYSLAVDNSGNVFVTGTTHVDYLTIKYDTAGNELWIRVYNGPGKGPDESNSIAVDNSGNAYITGFSQGNGTGYDFATIKYDAAGNEMWVRRYNGPGNADDISRKISVDNAGNVIVTGQSTGSKTGLDYATVKYDAAGNELWSKRFDGLSNRSDIPIGIKLDNFGNCYITGSTTNASWNRDFATIKYDAAGNELWVKRYEGSANIEDNATAIAIDDDGNVYVSGFSRWVGTGDDIVTIKYDAGGTEKWVISYNNSAVNGQEYPNAISVDLYGNVIVCGTSQGATSSYDFLTIKYSQDENTRAFVDLVKIYGAGNCKATFGYKFDHNENIPIGADNRFIPAPEDRGQPTAFTAGTHHELFEVSFSAPITWHVKSGTVTTEAEAVEKNIYSEVNDYITIMPGLNQKPNMR